MYKCIIGVYTCLALFWCDSLSIIFTLVDAFPWTSYRGYAQSPDFWLQSRLIPFSMSQSHRSLNSSNFSAVTHGGFFDLSLDGTSCEFLFSLHFFNVLTSDLFLQIWCGIMFDKTGNHCVWVDFTVPVIIIIASFNCASIRFTCELF